MFILLIHRKATEALIHRLSNYLNLPSQMPKYSCPLWCWAIPFVHAQMGLAPSPNCECGVSEQTADHVLTACPIHRAPHGARGLTVLDDETRCWLNNTTASI